jgi:hypothetical protein
MHHAHLTQSERYQIEPGVQAGLSERAVDGLIAAEFGALSALRLFAWAGGVVIAGFAR